MKIRNVLSAGALGLLSFACQTQNNLVIQTQRDQQPIIGGTAPQVGDFPTVVSILINQGANGLCTGTLVAPDLVLTAAHCIDPDVILLNSQAEVTAGTLVIFDSVDLFSAQGFAVGAVDTVPNPAFNLNALGSNDVGVIRLDQAINDRTPSAIDFNVNQNLVGIDTTLVGFGLTNPANQNSAGQEFFLSKQTTSCSIFGESDNFLVCYDQTNGTGSCSGDSGGPSFNQNGVVVGITSFGDQGCEIAGAYTKVTAELDFIQPFITVSCVANGACDPNCGAQDPDCCQGGDGFCDPGCGANDSDCANCAGDGNCNAACAQDGNMADPDCEGGNNACGADGVCGAGCGLADPDCEDCGFDGACNQNCGANGNPADLDCGNNAEGEGCAVNPTQESNTLPIVFVFGLFAFGAVMIRRSRRS